MTKKIIFLFFNFCLLLKSFSLYASDLHDESTFIQQKGRVTGLPVPRFVTLKGKKTYMRHGPSRSHAIMWEYKKRGLPVEVINEYDHWRKIRDMDGSEGWIHQTVLSGRRMVVVLEGDHIVRAGDGYTYDAVAQISGGLVFKPLQCKPNWCRVAHEQFEGWLPKAVLYGVYEEEVF